MFWKVLKNGNESLKVLTGIKQTVTGYQNDGHPPESKLVNENYRDALA